MAKGNLRAEDAYTYKGLSWDLLPLPLLNMPSVKFNNEKKFPGLPLKYPFCPWEPSAWSGSTDLKWIFYFLLQGIGGIVLLIEGAYFE